MRGTSFFLFLFFIFTLFMLTKIIDSIPPHKITINTINSLKERIENYIEIHNSLPENLKELPRLNGGNNAINDGWGNPIIYKRVDKNYEIVLSSLGKDLKEGGIGFNTDIIGRFHPIDDSGQLIKGKTLWAQDPADFAPHFNVLR